MALPEIVSPQESSSIGADPLRVVAGSRLAKPSRSDARRAPQENPHCCQTNGRPVVVDMPHSSSRRSSCSPILVLSVLLLGAEILASGRRV
jgi:hypothetical protein